MSDNRANIVAGKVVDNGQENNSKTRNSDGYYFPNENSREVWIKIFESNLNRLFMDLYELKDKNFLASKIKNNKNFKELTRNIGILAQKNDLQENKPNTEKENIEDLNMHKLKNIDTYNNNSALSYFYLDKDEMYIIAQEIYEKVLKHRNKAAENSLDFKKASIPSFDLEEFLTKIINERGL